MSRSALRHHTQKFLQKLLKIAIFGLWRETHKFGVWMHTLHPKIRPETLCNYIFKKKFENFFGGKICTSFAFLPYLDFILSSAQESKFRNRFWRVQKTKSQVILALMTSKSRKLWEYSKAIMTVSKWKLMCHKLSKSAPRL